MTSINVKMEDISLSGHKRKENPASPRVDKFKLRRTPSGFRAINMSPKEVAAKESETKRVGNIAASSLSLQPTYEFPSKFQMQPLAERDLNILNDSIPDSAFGSVNIVWYDNQEEFFKTISSLKDLEKVAVEVVEDNSFVRVVGTHWKVAERDGEKENVDLKFIFKDNVLNVHECINDKVIEEPLLRIDTSSGCMIGSVTGIHVKAEEIFKIYQYLAKYTPTSKGVEKEELLKLASSFSKMSLEQGMSILRSLGAPSVFHYELHGIERAALGHSFWVKWASKTDKTADSFLLYNITRGPYTSDAIDESSFSESMTDNYYIDIVECSTPNPNQKLPKPILSVRIPTTGIGEVAWVRRSMLKDSPINGEKSQEIHDKLVAPLIKCYMLVFDDTWQLKPNGEKDYPTLFLVLAGTAYYKKNLRADIAKGTFYVRDHNGKVIKVIQNPEEWYRALDIMMNYPIVKFCRFFKNWKEEYEIFIEIAKRLCGEKFLTDENATIGAFIQALKKNGTNDDKRAIFNKVIYSFSVKTSNKDVADFCKLMHTLEHSRVRAIPPKTT